MVKDVRVFIDGHHYLVPERTTILEAARLAGIKIPTLCYYKGLNEIGACRVCMVEVEGYDRLFTACNNTVDDNMVIWTNSQKVREARKTNVQLILSQHNANCTMCSRSGNCSLQSIANDMGIFDTPFRKDLPENKGNPHFPLIRDYQKCIKCMRCIQVCDKIQASHIWDVVNTGSRTTVDVKDVYALEDSNCALCGQCITHCPVNALHERDDTQKVMDAIYDPDKIIVAQIAPSIRTAWGESFGLTPEEATVERLAEALHLIGFNFIMDTDFSADLTIMEEASEFLEKVSHPENNTFPMFTSCCPGWIRYCKAHWSEFVDQLSTSKSPQGMFGAVAKSYYAKVLNVDPHQIYVVSIMPCVAKKAECAIPVLNDACGDPDVDVVITTREVVRMIRASFINPKTIGERALDMPLGLGSGAGNIFGATGGVMEAALRTAYYFATGKNPDPDAFEDVRGMNGWKEKAFDLAGKKLNVAVVNGLGNANKLLTALKKGEVAYDFVEVMACPGGCVGGGGQPIHDGEWKAPERADVLYRQDAKNILRFSHENPSIINLYKDYLGEPLSEKAEKLLHTDHHAWKMPQER